MASHTHPLIPPGEAALKEHCPSPLLQAVKSEAASVSARKAALEKVGSVATCVGVGRTCIAHSPTLSLPVCLPLFRWPSIIEVHSHDVVKEVYIHYPLFYPLQELKDLVGMQLVRGHKGA